MHYFVNIGSNLGNRSLNISRAVRAIAGYYGWFEMSRLIESEPWGYESGHPFMNVGVTFVSGDAPEDVLGRLQAIERELGSGSHRNAEGGYADRIVDIDIVAVDEEIIDGPTLCVPHRSLADREFFLKPMEELAPMWRHPVTGLTPSGMLEALRQQKAEAGQKD